MGRAKLSMALINSEKARYTTFQKRKKGLKKKTYELKTLCGVQVCLIIYGPKIDVDRQPEPEIWPQDREEIQELIDVYRKQPMEERKRRTSGVPNFLEDRNRKVEEAIGKLRAKNNEAKYPTWDDSYNEFTEEDLVNFFGILENKIQEVKARVEFINGNPRLVAPGMMDCVNMGSNPRLEALAAMVDRVKMEYSNPRLEAAAPMVDRVNMEYSSNPNESYFLPGLFNRRNMQWEFQKMKKSLEVDLMPMHHQYYNNPFDHHQQTVVDQLDGCSSSNNYEYNITNPFDRQINYSYHNEDHPQRMIDNNMVVVNTNTSSSVPRVPPGYYGSNVQPFVASPYMQYPVMASHASNSQVLHAAAAAASLQISDEYYYDPVSHHELHDIKNHN